MCKLKGSDPLEHGGVDDISILYAWSLAQP